MKGEKEVCRLCRGVFRVTGIWFDSPKLCPKCMKQRIKKDSERYAERCWRYRSTSYVDSSAPNESL